MDSRPRGPGVRSAGSSWRQKQRGVRAIHANTICFGGAWYPRVFFHFKPFPQQLINQKEPSRSHVPPWFSAPCFGTVTLLLCVLLCESESPALHSDTPPRLPIPFASVAQKEDLRVAQERSIGLLNVCRFFPLSVLHDIFSRAQVGCRYGAPPLRS